MDSSREKMQYLAHLYGYDFPLALVTLLHWGSPLGWPHEQPSEGYHLAASAQRYAIAVQVKSTTTCGQCHPINFSSGSSNCQTSSSQWQLQPPVPTPSGCATLAEKEEDFSFLVSLFSLSWQLNTMQPLAPSPHHHLFLNAVSELSDGAHPTSGEEQELSAHSAMSWKGQGLYGEYLKQAERSWFEAWAIKGRKESKCQCHSPPSFGADSLALLQACTLWSPTAQAVFPISEAEDKLSLWARGLPVLGAHEFLFQILTAEFSQLLKWLKNAHGPASHSNLCAQLTDALWENLLLLQMCSLNFKVLSVDGCYWLQ